MAIKFLSTITTQGGADAFVQSEFPTGVNGLNQGLRIRGFDIVMPSYAEVDSDYAIQFARRSGDGALMAYNDRRLIAQVIDVVKLTTSGLVIQERVKRFQIPRDFELIIVEDPCYILCDSSGSGSANAFSFRLYYELVKLSDLEKQTLLAESLNA